MSNVVMRVGHKYHLAHNGDDDVMVIAQDAKEQKEEHHGNFLVLGIRELVTRVHAQEWRIYEAPFVGAAKPYCARELMRRLSIDAGRVGDTLVRA